MGEENKRLGLPIIDPITGEIISDVILVGKTVVNTADEYLTEIDDFVKESVFLGLVRELDPDKVNDAIKLRAEKKPYGEVLKELNLSLDMLNPNSMYALNERLKKTIAPKLEKPLYLAEKNLRVVCDETTKSSYKCYGPAFCPLSITKHISKNALNFVKEIKRRLGIKEE